MSTVQLIILICLFAVTSIVGVVTGSNSLVTVPVMFQFGIDPKVAVATNMFGLTFMSIGATIPFFRQGRISVGRVSPMIVLTMAGSAIGAMLVGYVTAQSIKLIVSIAMISVTIFTIFQRRRADGEAAAAEVAGNGSLSGVRVSITRGARTTTASNSSIRLRSVCATTANSRWLLSMRPAGSSTFC